MKTIVKVIAPLSQECIIAEAARIVVAGGVIVYPTDTIYGIGADATNAVAVERIFSIKERERGKALLVLVASAEMAKQFIEPLTPETERILGKYWPGSVTFIFRANPLLPEILTAGTGTVGIRVPDNHFCRALCLKAGVPIVSTSANLSGSDVAGDVAQIMRDFDGIVDLVVDNGNTSQTTPSTVVDLTGDLPRIVRQGAVHFKQEELQ
ncbi:MAG: L-threonylcarbamoyladenylate synthase [Ignavibacteriales bacterium]|nr:L-threonylcarbamoyladenylate synthase [Ignavibacteriales bacterium]